MIAHDVGAALELTGIFSPPDSVIRGLQGAMADNFTRPERVMMVTCNLMPEKCAAGTEPHGKNQFSDRRGTRANHKRAFRVRRARTDP